MSVKVVYHSYNRSDTSLNERIDVDKLLKTCLRRETVGENGDSTQNSVIISDIEDDSYIDNKRKKYSKGNRYSLSRSNSVLTDDLAVSLRKNSSKSKTRYVLDRLDAPIELSEWICNYKDIPLYLSGSPNVGKSYFMKTYLYNNFKGRIYYIDLSKSKYSLDSLSNDFPSKFIPNDFKDMYNTLFVFDHIDTYPCLVSKLYSYFSSIKSRLCLIGRNSELVSGYNFYKIRLNPLSLNEFIHNCKKYDISYLVDDLGDSGSDSVKSSPREDVREMDSIESKHSLGKSSSRENDVRKSSPKVDDGVKSSPKVDDGRDCVKSSPNEKKGRGNSKKSSSVLNTINDYYRIYSKLGGYPRLVCKYFKTLSLSYCESYYSEIIFSDLLACVGVSKHSHELEESYDDISVYLHDLSGILFCPLSLPYSSDSDYLEFLSCLSRNGYLSSYANTYYFNDLGLLNFLYSKYHSDLPFSYPSFGLLYNFILLTFINQLSSTSFKSETFSYRLCVNNIYFNLYLDTHLSDVYSTLGLDNIV